MDAEIMEWLESKESGKSKMKDMESKQESDKIT